MARKIKKVTVEDLRMVQGGGKKGKAKKAAKLDEARRKEQLDKLGMKEGDGSGWKKIKPLPSGPSAPTKMETPKL